MEQAVAAAIEAGWRKKPKEVVGAESDSWLVGEIKF